MSGDSIRESITGFHQKVEQAHAVLVQRGKQIEDRKGEILHLLESGVRIPEPPQENGEYQRICREMMKNAEAQMKGWQKSIQEQIQRSEFVNRHEKSVLVMVFADVNAGKSTLGNFVAGYYLQGTPYADLWQEDLVFRVEDRSKASQDEYMTTVPRFQEGAVETTSTIQYFTLSQGLTWVDTPGLHSLTAEHGELAQEYIQFADLVVYLTPSSSPFKQDEREMLADLFRRGKPVILAVTKSDVYQKEWVDNKRIKTLRRKSEEARSQQENFVRDEIRNLAASGLSVEELLKNSHYLSLSVRLAKAAVEAGDASLFHDSNLDGFLSQMGTLLSRDAMELKMRRPIAEINACIDRLTGSAGAASESSQESESGAGKELSIADLHGTLKSRLSDLKKLDQDCRRESRLIWAEIAQQIPYALDMRLRGLRSGNQIGNPEAVRREMSEAVAELTEETCRRHLERLLGEAVQAASLPSLTIRGASGAGYQTTTMERSVQRRETRDARGIIENVQKFFNPDKEFYRYYTDMETVAVGDNFASFLNEQAQALRPEVEKYISRAVEKMAADCVKPMLNCYEELDRQLGDLSQSLQKLRMRQTSV